MTTIGDSMHSSDSSVLWLVNILRRGRLPLLVLPILAFLISYAIIRWRTPYSAETTLRPQGSSQSTNRLSGLAAQFGVSLSNGALGDPVRFQASLLRTREVLAPVVKAQYAIATARGSSDSTRGSFLDLYHIKGRTLDERVLRGVERLRDLMSLETDALAGLITVRVTTRWPELSLRMSQRLLESLNIANTSLQQASAEAEARFASERLDRERAALEGAEDALQNFLLQNRQYQSSPSLVLTYGRLQRRIDLAQQVSTSLAQSYEQARIDAARNTPTVNVVDHPEGSVRAVGRPLRDGVVWALTALGLVMLVLLAQDSIHRFRERQRDDSALAELRGPYLPDLTREAVPDNREVPSENRSTYRS